MTEPNTTPGLDLGQVRRLVRASHSRMGAPLDAETLEDAVQEVAILAWARRDELRDPSKLDAWIYGTARRVVLRILERRRRREGTRDVLDGPEEPTADPRTPIDTGLVRGISTVLRDLGTTSMRIVQRRLVDGHSFARIAREGGQAESSVRSRFLRALPLLRDRLRPFQEGRPSS